MRRIDVTTLSDREEVFEEIEGVEIGAREILNCPQCGDHAVVLFGRLECADCGRTCTLARRELVGEP